MHALTQPCRDSRSANTQAGMRRAWADLADSLGRSRRRNGSDNALPRCHGGEQRNGRLRLSLRHPGRQCTGLLPDRSNHRLRGRSPAAQHGGAGVPDCGRAWGIYDFFGVRDRDRQAAQRWLLPGRFGLRAPTVSNWPVRSGCMGLRLGQAFKAG